MVEDFKDGANNDLFSVSVDGHAGRLRHAPGSSTSARPRATRPARSTRCCFRASGTAAPALAGKGLLIDGLTTSTLATPPLAPCALTADDASKTLTLTADCTTWATLTVPNEWTLDGAGHTITVVHPAGGTFTGPVVTNEAAADAEMHITDLTVDGDLDTACSSSLTGIQFDGASGSLTDTTVSNIRYGTGSGCQSGNSINITNPAGSGRTSVTVADVHVTGFQKTGIRLNGAVGVQLTGSSIADAQLDDVTASNSLQIGRGARAYVSGNTIGGNDWDGDTEYSATGVLLYGAGDVTFTHNVITGTDTDYGMYAYEDATYPAGHLALTCNLVERSEVADSTGGARDLWNTGVAVDGALAGTVSAAGNTVRGFATSFDGVTNTVGGDCATGPVGNLHATGSTTSLTATWSAPTGKDYAPVDHYDVTLTPGGATQTVTAPTRRRRSTASPSAASTRSRSSR